MPSAASAPPGAGCGGQKSTVPPQGRVSNATQHAKTTTQQGPIKLPQKKDPTKRIMEAMNMLQTALPGQLNVKVCVMEVKECIAELRKTLSAGSNTSDSQPLVNKTVAKQISEIHQALTSPTPKDRTWAQIAGPSNAPPKPKRDHTTEITIRPTEENIILKEATTSKDILRNLDKHMNRVGPIAAKKLQSGDIRLVVQHKEYALRNKDAI